MTKLRCFVAMAFNRKDTDDLYKNHISPAIKDANLTPIQLSVNDLYLDRVDDKIRKEISKADVVIADLTYARPSVYWEAGYAERNIPVIYTCRKDHFDKTQIDQNQTLIIHFDLQNANILPWSEHNQETFRKKLTQRLNLAVRDKRIQREKNENFLRLTEEFNKLPVKSQLLGIEVELARWLTDSCGFTIYQEKTKPD